MDDQFHNDLKNRINEAFDRFEVPAGAADAGWNELRKRFPAREQRRTAAWWWSSAAAVILLALLSVWLYRPAKPVAHLVVKNRPATHRTQPQHSVTDLADSVLTHPSTSALQLLTQQQAAKQKHWSGSINTDAVGFPDDQIGSAPAGSIEQQRNTRDSAISVNTIAMQRAQAKSLPVLPADSPISATNSLAATLPANTTPADAPPVTNTEKASGMEQIFAREAKAAKNATTNTQTTSGTGQRLALSVYAGTFINYAKGSSNEINVGAGVLSDIKLAKRFKLVTGIAIAQNKLNYDSQPTQENVYAAAVAATGGQNITPLAVNAFFSPTANARNTTQITGYNANFTGLDIPLNIKYEFGSGSNDTYVLAGVSSGTFINETYRYNYSSSLFNSISQTAETQSRFSTFDFARTLNLAFGVGTPVGKTNRLIIEPFLKYPISGMGSQQIRFGASGINLKFRFLSHK